MGVSMFTSIGMIKLAMVVNSTKYVSSGSNTLEKWFPILQGEGAHSLYFWSFQKTNLLKVITFSTDYKYTT